MTQSRHPVAAARNRGNTEEMSEEDAAPRGPGRPVGWRKEDVRDGDVRLRVRLADKGRWVRAARGRGMSLSAWLEEIANREAAESETAAGE